MKDPLHNITHQKKPQHTVYIGIFASLRQNYKFKEIVEVKYFQIFFHTSIITMKFIVKL